MSDRLHHDIAIIGGGLMGSGLVRLFARHGHAVHLYDRDAGFAEKATAGIANARAARSIDAAVERAFLVIEAVTEEALIKQPLFAELARVAAPDTLLATNSSVIPVGVVSAQVPDHAAPRVLGMHFWNPPDVIPLVEVIQGPRTALVSIETAMALLRAVGKEPVHVRRDVVPGNRMQHVLWREAMALVDEGVCTAEDVDFIVKRSFGLRLPVLGPLENADLIGLDLTESIHRVVMPTVASGPRPARGLLERLQQKRLGVKSGAGFYDSWTTETTAALRRRLTAHLERLLGVVK